MRNYKPIGFRQRIGLRIWACRCLILALFVFAVIVSLTGGGDSRIVTQDAHAVMAIIYFGSLAWAVWRSWQLKKLLRWPGLQKEQLIIERDERRKYLHDKSGGIVWDALTVCVLFITLVCALYNMDAFRAARAILLLALVFKGAAYLYYSRG